MEENYISSYNSSKRVITDTSTTTYVTAVALGSCNALVVGVGGGGACDWRGNSGGGGSGYMNWKAVPLQESITLEMVVGSGRSALEEPVRTLVWAEGWTLLESPPRQEGNSLD